MAANPTPQQADTFRQYGEAIMAKLVQTGSMREAFDSVIGDGTFSKLAGDVYDTLRARSAA